MSSTEVKNMNTADFADLDKMLAHMAEETPPVPEDFHDNWLRAVREEAARETAGEKHSGESGRQWRRLLGVAAVFLFLIGGTFLYRGGMRNPSVVKNQSAPAAVEGTPAPSPETAVYYTAAEEADYSMEEEPAYEEAYEPDAEMAIAEEESAPAADARAGAAEVRAGSENEGAAANGAAAKSASMAVMGTAEPIAADERTGEPEKEEAEENEETPETRNESEFVLFLRDMIEFLKAAAPYLLGAAVIAAAVMIIRRRKV